MTNEEIIETTDRTHIGVYGRFPVAFERGEGVRLWDVDGREYLDFFSGLAVSNLGHAHPAVVAAIHQQADRLLHVSNLYYHEPGSRLGELLIENSFADRVFFANSGAEANEAAIKLARKYGTDRLGGRYEIITASGSFHGRTMATVSATGQEKHQSGFQPMLQGFRYVPFGDLDAAAASLRDETVAIFVEPVQGEGGVRVPPDGYLRGLRELCDRQGILLIFDEVQTGVGRTGTLFGYQHEGVEPDVMSIAKGLGNGLPIGAALTTETVAEIFTPGAHGSTFGGNPVCSAAAAAVIETLVDGKVLAGARDASERIFARLRKLETSIDAIRDVRGRGLLIGVELDRPAKPCVDAALAAGLIVNACADKVLRLLPPLVIEAADVERGLDILEDVLRGELT